MCNEKDPKPFVIYFSLDNLHDLVIGRKDFSFNYIIYSLNIIFRVNVFASLLILGRPTILIQLRDLRILCSISLNVLGSALVDCRHICKI